MIRRAEPKDVASIFLLERNAFLTEWWDKNQIEQDLIDSNKMYYVMQQEDEVIAFVSFLKAIDEADLLQIVVSPAYRGQGLGTKLLSFALKEMKKQGIKKIFLEVRASNPARVFYKNNGFRRLSTRKNYYGDEDGIVYMRNI